MSTDLTPDAVWSSFSDSLARALRETPQDDSFALELKSDDDSGACRYVQFCAYGPGRIRCEVVSNEYLAPSLRHTVDDLRWLAARGWGEPGDPDGQGSPNHYLDADVEWAEFAADQIVMVFRELWGVADIGEIMADRDLIDRLGWVAPEGELR